jgi:hypothetical protein
MSGFGIGHGVGLDPKMLAGGGGAGGGGGGFQPTFSHFEQATAWYMEGLVGPFEWDRPANNIDPDGMLETVDYSLFTMPRAGILTVHLSFGYIKSDGNNELYHRMRLRAPDGSDFTPFIDYHMSWKDGYYGQASSGGHLTVEVEQGFQFRIWCTTGGGWGTSYTDQRQRADIILWSDS